MSLVIVFTNRRVADDLQAERPQHADEYGEVSWIPTDEGSAREVLDEEYERGCILSMNERYQAN